MTTMMESRPVRIRWRPLAMWGLSVAVLVVNATFVLRGRGQIEAAAAQAQPLHLPNLSLVATAPAAIQLHMLAITLAVPLGAAMLHSKKGARFHRIAGWAWVVLMLVGSLAPLLALNVPHYGWAPIHLTIPLVLSAVIPAVVAARAHKVKWHRGLMIWAYVMLVFAGVGTLAPTRLIWRMFFG